MLNDVLIPSRASDRHAVALVVVLSFLVLITGVVVAFFSLSVLQHQVSHSSASLTSVELFARGALNATVGDVQQEIVDGSTTPAPNQSPTPAAYPPIYLPKTAANAVPAPQGTPPPSSTSAAPGTENLLKRSARTAPFYPNGVTRAAASATTTASVNGRSVPLARWNKPLLMAKASSGSATDLTPVNAFTAPDWILVNNARVGDAGTAGNPTTWNPNMIWSNVASNQTAVVGRYAYTIYDEGGLLDANVAGYPAPIAPGSTTGTNYVYKNAEAFADLTQLGLTQQQINALIGWRNNSTMSASGSLPTYSMDLTAAGGQLNYRNFILGNTNGFLATANAMAGSSSGTTDHQFATRQSLIQFLVNGVGQGGTAVTGLQNVLQYLGTFTRSVNAPSYSPPPDSTRHFVQQSYPGYGLDKTYNPSLINDIRVTVPFTRDSDGTRAQIGEPLIKYRFSLNRLALFGNNNDKTADTNSDIYKYFGLFRSLPTASWVYNHNGNSILTLDKVAQAGREPDFFELLQAGIALGSLGQYYNTNLADDVQYDKFTPGQIIQIGANIMDQYDTDSYPTAITLQDQTYYGLECLPYITQVYNVVWTKDPTTVGPTFWYQPAVWNPQVTANTDASTTPTNFRFRVALAAGHLPSVAFSDNPGELMPPDYYQAQDQTVVPAVVWPSSDPPNPATTNVSSAVINFTPSSKNNYFNFPSLLTSTQDASAIPANVIGDPNNNLGVLVAQCPNTRPPRKVLPYRNAIDDLTASDVFYYLEYLPIGGSTWLKYDQIRYRHDGSNGSHTTYGLGQYDFGKTGYAQLYHNYQVVRSDPRTDRFGVVESYDGGSHATVRPGARDDGLSVNPSDVASPGWTYADPTGSFDLGALSDNLSNSWARYSDADGVLRPGLGAYTAGGAGGVNGVTSNGGYPLASDSYNATHSRPVVLNRAFRSVADLGYASRSTPWKNLDFFSSTTADAALLDLFCVDPTPASLQLGSLAGSYPDISSKQADVPLRAGTLGINTKQKPVLQALFAGAIKQEALATPSLIPVNSADMTALANNLVALTSITPLINRSELASIWSAALTYSSQPDTNIKANHESAIRALADVGNTRTWNLLIDLVAQTGRYPNNASKLDQFNVEGERRYWLHVAIDRYTGKVVSQNLEPVYE